MFAPSSIHTQLLSSSPRQSAQDRACLAMPLAFAAHFRCPSELPRFASVEGMAPHAEFFRLADVMCCGRRRIGATKSAPVDVSTHVQYVDEQVQLPFDLSEVVANFQQEHYHRRSQGLLER